MIPTFNEMQTAKPWFHQKVLTFKKRLQMAP